MKDTVVLAVLSANLTMLLESKGWTLRELAAHTGDSISTLHGIISGKSLPRAGLLKRLADAFEISVDQLYDPNLKKALKKNLSVAS